MPTTFRHPSDVLRPRSTGEALEAQTEALLLADEIFIRMVVWAAAGIIAGTFTFLFHWVFLFPELLFGAAWVAAADSRTRQIKLAANWQKYIDSQEEEL